ncbi:MAG: hypothetical protein AAB152_01380 [Candidatus Coatesbacteria bacterium]
MANGHPARGEAVTAARRGAVFLAWLAAGAWATRDVWARWQAAFRGLLAGLADSPPESAGILGHALAGHAAAAGGLVALLAAAVAAGGLPARWAGMYRGGPSGGGAPGGGAADRLAWQWLAGWGVLSLAGFALGLTGLLRGPVLAAAAIAVPAAGLRGLCRGARAVGRPSPGLPVILLGLVLLAGFLLTRLPSTHEDPMVYHFAAPEEYLRAGRIHAEVTHIQWTMPLGLEMLYLVPWWVAGITAAKLVNLGMILTACLAIRGIAAALGGPGVWAAFLFASAGLVGNLLWQGKNDLACAAFAAGAGLGVARALAGRSGGWLAAGWCAGCAVACRLTAGVTMVPLAVAALVVAGHRVRPIAAVSGVIAGLAACGPWLVRSWLDAGNPFTLFASGIFPDLAWSPFLQAALRHYTLLLSSAGPFHPSDLVMGAWHVLGVAEIGSLALLVLGGLGLVAVRGTTGTALRIAMASAYVIWLPTERNPRFLLPLVPWVAAFAACAAFAGGDARSRTGRIAAAALVPLGVAAAGAALVHAGALASPDGPAVWTGMAGPDAVRRRQNTTAETTRRWVNAALPGDARLLLTGGAKRLGFARRVMSTGPIGMPPFWVLTHETSTPAEMRKRLRQRGATHWMHNFIEGEFRGLGWYPGPKWDERQLALGVEFMRRYARPVRAPEAVDHEGGGYWVFELTRAPGGFPPMFLPGTEGRLKAAFDLRDAGDAGGAFGEAGRLAGPAVELLEVQAIMATFALQARQAATSYKWFAPGVRAGYIGDGNLDYFAATEVMLGRPDAAVRDAARAARVLGPDRRLLARALQDRARARAGRGDRAGAARDSAEAARWWRGARLAGGG